METHFILVLEFLQHRLICAEVLLHPVVGAAEGQSTGPPTATQVCSPLDVSQEPGLLLQDSSVVHTMVVPLLLQTNILLLGNPRQAHMELSLMQWSPSPLSPRCLLVAMELLSQPLYYPFQLTLPAVRVAGTERPQPAVGRCLG